MGAIKFKVTYLQYMTKNLSLKKYCYLGACYICTKVTKCICGKNNAFHGWTIDGIIFTKVQTTKSAQLIAVFKYSY